MRDNGPLLGLNSMTVGPISGNSLSNHSLQKQSARRPILASLSALALQQSEHPINDTTICSARDLTPV